MSSLYSLEVKRLEGLKWKSRFHSEIPTLYVQVIAGGEIRTTRTIKEDRSPAWNERLIFHQSSLSDVCSIRVLHDSKWLSDPCVGTFQTRISDLLMECAEGEASFNLTPPSERKSAEPAGTLVLYLETIDEMAATAVMIDDAGDALQKSGVTQSEQVSDTMDALNERVTQHSNGSDLYQAIGQLLSSLDALTKVVDVISEIHPYLTLSWYLTSGLMKAVKHVYETDKKVVELILTMEGAFTTARDTLSLPNKASTLKKSIGGLLKQTIECCLFIRQYTSQGFGKRLFDLRSSPKIDEFQQAFTVFRKEIDSGVILHTALVLVRISHGVDELLLRQRLKPDEIHISDDRICHPDTRTEILEDIREWMYFETDQNILWLHGVAGSGKSTVSMTIAEHSRSLSRLGGFLTFQRGKSEPSSVIRTIAYKLALFDSTIASRILSDTNDDKDISTASLSTQFDRLLLRPLSAVPESLPGPIVIVLDALDECGTTDSRRNLMQVLRRELPKIPNNFRFLITSRRELDINNALSTQPNAVYAMELDCRSIASYQDVLLYLRTALFEAVIEQVELQVAEDWDWGENVETLGKKAGGLFIWASTAVKMIANSDNPFSALEDLVSDTNLVTHFGLDELYATALRNSGIDWKNGESKSRFANVLALVLLSKAPLSSKAIDDILGFPPRKSSLLVLSRLRSLLTYSLGSPVSLFHTSFSDYLVSPDRARDPWYIDIEAQKHFITTRCFSIMQDMLHFNMCELETSYVGDNDVPGIDERVKRLIPPHLEYACLFWSGHLCELPYSSELSKCLSNFAYQHLLFWFEVLSLVMVFQRFASRALHDASAWAASCEELSSFLSDAGRLASEFALSIVRSTPHIYISMIPFTKDESEVSKHYSMRMSSWAQIERKGVRRPPMWVAVLEGHSDWIYTISVSPDGTHIASAGLDGDVRVWDIESGETVVILVHDDSVVSVSYSPSGEHLASCSGTALRIWDAEEGNVILGPLEWHTGRVRSLAYSPDGKMIVSCSEDKTVIIWDALSGEVIAVPLIGHTATVHSVTFSPDSTHIASASEDETIRIWNVERGELVLEPLAHSDEVRSITFSPDKTHIASGCNDGKIRIWNAQGGKLVSEHFLRHTSAVMCVAYSACGTNIVSGSADATIFVWNATSGVIISGPFEGHTSIVTSVKFSPDGESIISGSGDRTVRIWRTNTRRVDSAFAGHTGGVLSVAFSADGSKIASASTDKTIMVWDSRTGEAITGSLCHHTHDFNSVVFSSDNSRLVAASDDKTVRIWSVENGMPISGPMVGHTDKVMCVALSRDGVQLVSGSLDRTLRVWNMDESKLVAGPLQGHTRGVRSISFAPDGKRLASASTDKTIRIWDTKTWEIIMTPLTRHEEGVNSVCFSPDSTLVVSGSEDETIIVWNAENGQVTAGPFTGHDNWVWAVIFLRNGSHVVSGSSDNTIRIWNIENGQTIGDTRFGHSNTVTSLALSSDGTRIASGSLDKTIKVWDVPAILRYSQKRSNRVTTDAASHEQDFSDWILGENGWILGGPEQEDLLLWIPPDLRRTLLLPQNAAICSDFWTKLDFTGAALGKRWTECFVSK